MRSLTDEETKTFFEKLAKWFVYHFQKKRQSYIKRINTRNLQNSIGRNIQHLIDSKDEE